MRRSTGRVIALGAALCGVALLAPAAYATCISSAAAGGGISDNPDDSGPPATPELTRLDVATDTSCGISILPVIGGDLASGAKVTVYVDVDGDPRTGDASGADHVFPVPEPYAVTATFDELGMKSPGTLNIRAETRNPSPAFAFAVDRVPDTGWFGFPVYFRTGCVVPRLKNVRRSTARKRLHAAGCRYSIRGRGRVRRVSHRKGTRTAETVVVRCGHGQRKPA